MWPWRKRITATIGDGVRIRGQVEADGDLELAGEVHGDVTVSGTLVLRSSARLYGDIRCETLQIEQGAFFAGTNRMGEGSTHALPAPTPTFAPSQAPAPAFNATQASGPSFSPTPPRAITQTPALAPAQSPEAPLAILMAPVGNAEREMLGTMPKAESPAFYGGFNSAVKGA
ncbi:MAG TPA: polymer-forming cytoskeletal protein [Symbiobacteriaceae bacterium]|nr:polymer-forming cytoskeletal protein [Symbiobacteriaceae bacterium]